MAVDSREPTEAKEDYHESGGSGRLPLKGEAFQIKSRDRGKTPTSSIRMREGQNRTRDSESYLRNGIDKNNFYLDNINDMTVLAGNRLYVQALERFKRHEAMRGNEFEDSKQPSVSSSERHGDESLDSWEGNLSVKAGNRLYSQAVERLRRHKVRWAEVNEDSKQPSLSSIERILDDSLDSVEIREDPSVKAGNRLYSQALERLRRHETKRKESLALEGRKQSKKVGINFPCSDYSDNVREDKTVEAGKRLYSQALEQIKKHKLMIQEASYVSEERTTRIISEEQIDSHDLTVQAGNRLYTAAIERFERQKARNQQAIDEEIEYVQSLQRFGDNGKEASDRLYIQALEQIRRRDAMRAEASKPYIPKLALATQKIQERNDNVDRWDRLYRLSTEKQIEGRQRRAQIEEEKSKAKRLPESKVLPISHSSDMYIRGLERLFARETRLALIAEELESQRRRK